VRFTPESDRELAGMAYFQNDKNYFVIGKTMKGFKQVIVIQSVVDGINSIVAEKELSSESENKELSLSISVKAGEASFTCSFNGKKLILLADKVDVTNLSTKKAGGFVGSVVGMYTTSAK